jgi:hypothetical protein
MTKQRASGGIENGLAQYPPEPMLLSSTKISFYPYQRSLNFPVLLTLTTSKRITTTKNSSFRPFLVISKPQNPSKILTGLKLKYQRLKNFARMR